MTYTYLDDINEQAFERDLGVPRITAGMASPKSQSVRAGQGTVRSGDPAAANAESRRDLAVVRKRSGPPRPVAAPLLFKPLSEFASVREPSARALLGDERNTVLPAGGLMLKYGAGGAGKTTSTVDAAAHMSAGVPWLGLPVEKPVRIVLVENEGPRGKFRDKLNAKLASWPGPPETADNILVLEEPWSLFSFANEPHREQLRAAIVAHQADLVVLGPVVRLGVEGGGTPAELAEFLVLLELVRVGLKRPLAYWLVHHENKQGDVSGAWSGIPDTIAHVQAQGNGRTRLVWEKVRWGSELHGTGWNLTWADGASFQLEESRERNLHVEMPPALAGNPENPWLTRDELAKLMKAKKETVAAVASDLVQAGILEFAKGPAGRSGRAHCWRLATRPKAAGESGRVTLLDGAKGGNSPTRPPSIERGAGAGELASPAPLAPEAGASTDGET